MHGHGQSSIRLLSFGDAFAISQFLFSIRNNQIVRCKPEVHAYAMVSCSTDNNFIQLFSLSFFIALRHLANKKFAVVAF